MSNSKKLAEQIELAKKEIELKNNKLEELKKKHKAQANKERTHRLIERGAILESLIDGAAEITNEQVKEFLIKTIQTEFARRIFAQLKEQNSEKVHEIVENEAVREEAG